MLRWHRLFTFVLGLGVQCSVSALADQVFAIQPNQWVESDGGQVNTSLYSYTNTISGTYVSVAFSLFAAGDGISSVSSNGISFVLDRQIGTQLVFSANTSSAPGYSVNLTFTLTASNQWFQCFYTDRGFSSM